MGSNYSIAYKAEWDKLKKLDPKEVSKRLGVKYLSDKNQLIVPFVNNNYILDFNTEDVYIHEGNLRYEISDSIIILNYLTHSTEYITNTNKWVSLKEIPNGGALFYPAFYKMTIEKLIKVYGENLKGFEEKAINLGGKAIKFGDIGYEFNLLPKISISIGIWSGDEEITPNAQILFESSIQHLLHIETVIGIGICLCDKFIKGT